MTNLSPTELEKLAVVWDATLAADQEFLKQRGWVEFEENRCRHPAHGDKIYTWANALDTAEMDLVRELGWVSIAQHTLIPEFLKPHKDDFSDLRYVEDCDWNDHTHTRDGEPIVWGRYVHPISGKIYTYLEAAEIARFHSNSEEQWLASGAKPSGWHIQVQALLGDRRLAANEVLWLKFGPRNPPTDMENVYSLLSIDIAGKPEC